MKKSISRSCMRRNPYIKASTPKLYHRREPNYGRRARYLLAILAIMIATVFSTIAYLNKSSMPEEVDFVEETVTRIDIKDSYIYCALEGIGRNINNNTDAISAPLVKTSPLIQKKLGNTFDLYTINQLVGPTTLKLGSSTLTNQVLPTTYYSGIDYSSFQPYMSYKKITSKSSPAYKISYSENAYTDSLGFRRYKTNTESQFTINGEDDYIVAMGTFYKTKGTAGERFLVVTTTGAFTVITGDEKADQDTDSMNMFTTHKGSAAIIEWIVDESRLESDVKQSGTVTSSSLEALHGTITSIYKIE